MQASSRLTKAAVTVALLGITMLAPGIVLGQDAAKGGPVRLARISNVSGELSLRTSAQGQWSEAALNLPVRQGCELSAGPTGRGEIQFDDGSKMRLGGGAVVTLTQLYSDDQGEFTQITLRNGAVNLRLSKAPSVYQVDAPLASVDVSGPARVRIDAGSGMSACVFKGSAVVQGAHGKITLEPSSTLRLASANDPLVAEPLPAQDSFDKWTASLDARCDSYEHSPHRDYAPANVAVASDNLDEYGEWKDDPQYGHVWHPTITDASWRPYHHGHWVWVDPFGWTWVAAEPWGWAPYHYGTWVHEPYGWVWVPGTRAQYWSPAVVDFYQTGADIAWCPLAPAEVVYPASISIGFRSGNWSLFFSIGGAAMYYPNAVGVCSPSPWSAAYINRSVTVVNFTTINNYYGGHGPGFNHNGFVPGAGFVPFNARAAAGGSIAQVSAFGGRGDYRALPAGAASSFRGGHFVGAPANGAPPMAGPPAARPTAASTSFNRSFRPAPAASHAALARNVFHAGGAAGSFAAARSTIAQPPPAAPRVAAHTVAPAAHSAATKPGSFGRTPTAASNPALNAANSARAALGKPTSTGTHTGGFGSPNHAGAAQHTAATQHTAAPTHPTAVQTQHPSNMTHSGAGPVHSTPHSAVPTHTASSAAPTHHASTPQHTAASPTHHASAPTHHASAPQHTAAAPVHSSPHVAAPTHHAAAPPQHASPPPPHAAPPQHSAPHQGPPPSHSGGGEKKRQ